VKKCDLNVFDKLALNIFVS